MENIRSKLIKNQDEFTEIHKKIANLCKETNVDLIELINPFDYYMYYFVKSHRFSVTEGNTTTVGEFTQLVVEDKKNKSGYVVPKKKYNETYEITNLKKLYDYLNRTKNIREVPCNLRTL